MANFSSYRKVLRKVPTNVRRRDRPKGTELSRERDRLAVTFKMALEAASFESTVGGALGLMRRWLATELRDQRGRTLTPEMRREASEMYRLGWKPSTVARALKISRDRARKLEPAVRSRT